MTDFTYPTKPTPLTIERDAALAWFVAWATAAPEAQYQAPGGRGCAYFDLTGGSPVGSCAVGQLIDSWEGGDEVREWIVRNNLNTAVGVGGLYDRDLIALTHDEDRLVADALSFAQDANDNHYPRWFVAHTFRRALEMGGNHWQETEEWRALNELVRATYPGINV